MKAAPWGYVESAFIPKSSQSLKQKDGFSDFLWGDLPRSAFHFDAFHFLFFRHSHTVTASDPAWHLQFLSDTTSDLPTTRTTHPHHDNDAPRQRLHGTLQRLPWRRSAGLPHHRRRFVEGQVLQLVFHHHPSQLLVQEPPRPSTLSRSPVPRRRGKHPAGRGALPSSTSCQRQLPLFSLQAHCRQPE